MLRDLIVNENEEHLYYQLLWFVQSAVLSNLNENKELPLQNWSSILNFYFDRLLTKTEHLSVFEILQHYRNNKGQIDSSFQSSMAGFISELQGERDLIPFGERDFDKKMSYLSVAELKVAAYEVGRISECKAQYLLSILFHFRILQLHGSKEEQPSLYNHLIEEVTVNLQSTIGFTFISCQPLLNSPQLSYIDPKGCRSLLACFDEITLAVKLC